MSNQQTSCVHRGNTFFASVEVVGGGPESKVRVVYNGQAHEGPLDGFTVDVAAHLLLRELVVKEFEADGPSDTGHFAQAGSPRSGLQSYPPAFGAFNRSTPVRPPSV